MDYGQSLVQSEAIKIGVNSFMVLTTANASFLWWNDISQLYGVDGNNMLFPIIDLMHYGSI